MGTNEESQFSLRLQAGQPQTKCWNKPWAKKIVQIELVQITSR